MGRMAGHDKEIGAIPMAITTRTFGVKPDGQAVTQYTMTNSCGASVSVIDFGGIVTNILVPDRDGVLGDVDAVYELTYDAATGISRYQKIKSRHMWFSFLDFS